MVSMLVRNFGTQVKPDTVVHTCSLGILVTWTVETRKSKKLVNPLAWYKQEIW